MFNASETPVITIEKRADGYFYITIAGENGGQPVMSASTMEKAIGIVDLIRGA